MSDRPLATLILPAFNRFELLEMVLESVARQDCVDALEVIVVNDGEVGVPDSLCAKHGFKCVFTGDKDERMRPLPAGARHGYRGCTLMFNEGVRIARGDVAIIATSDIYQVGASSISELISPLASDEFALCMPGAGKDDDGRFVQARDETLFDALPPLVNVQRVPFCMAMMKKHYLDIGGFDMDMDGGAWYVDDDLMDRLRLIGCHITPTGARIVHLFHGAHVSHNSAAMKNHEIYLRKQGIIVRNGGLRQAGAPAGTPDATE